MEHIVIGLETAHSKGVPPDADLVVVLETLSHGAWLEHNLVIECFHRVPVPWLAPLSRDHESLLHGILTTYAEAIGEKVGGYKWPFADEVSTRMQLIFDTTSAIRTKTLALRSLMIAADKLGRHAPQRRFCDYLTGIKTIDLALPVAEMITEFGTPHIRDFQGFNIDLYHPAIQTALKGLRIKPYDDEDLHGMEPPNELDPGDVDNMV